MTVNIFVDQPRSATIFTICHLPAVWVAQMCKVRIFDSVCTSSPVVNL